MIRTDNVLDDEDNNCQLHEAGTEVTYRGQMI